jgi:N-acetylglucosaminyldiphosphoundecaprenol N-acetyl-beta-D-mannosaminyltransferase
LTKKDVKERYQQFDFEKLSGSDMVYDFCEFAQKNNYKIFFLGGKQESNQSAVHSIKEKYNIAIAGYSPNFENYPFSYHFNDSCLNAIKQFKPEILFVGFGAPKQEYWADDNMAILSKVGVKYIVGCGGTFDFVAHKVKRAPVFIQKIGLEGVYRFLQEPNKLRYKRLIDSFKFFKYIWHKPEFK